MDKKHDFMNGNAFGLLVMDLLMGSITSALPEGSWIIFFMNTIITVIGMCLARYWWKTVPNNIRYNSLVAFVMLVSAGIFAVTPILRICFGSFLFWLLLLLYVVVLGYTMYKKELIFQAFHRPERSKIAKGTIIFLLVLFGISAFTFRNGQELIILQLLDDHHGGFFMALLMYGLGLFFTFISSALLKKPEEIRS